MLMSARANPSVAAACWRPVCGSAARLCSPGCALRVLPIEHGRWVTTRRGQRGGAAC